MVASSDGSLTLRRQAYRIQTPRLIIRCWSPLDAELLQVAVNESLDHLRQWMLWAKQEPRGLDATIAHLQQCRGQFDLGQDFSYGVFSPDERYVLGGTGLHTRVGPDALEIGYWIHAHHINQGLATELSAALVKIAFELHQIRRVEIHCDPSNVRSAAVPQKLGFTHEGTLRQRLLSDDGCRGDRMIWTLLADEYLASPAAKQAIAAFDIIGRPLALSPILS